MYKHFKIIGGSVCEHSIIRTTDGWIIPFDPANSDYQAYLKWLEEGNQPLPAETPSEE